MPSDQHVHGLCGNHDWDEPVCVAAIDVNARTSFTGIKAHEYNDVPAVLEQKVKQLAGMLRAASNPCVLTGAGISVAAGIADYASKKKRNNTPSLRDWKDAEPTLAHRCLTELHFADLMPHWIQQNHDSLPQKAGFPQQCLNEIHGSLHDPSNPVVPYEGTLRDDFYEWMCEWKATSDFCLAIGTSLSGFNVDSVAQEIATRGTTDGYGGLAIINLQKTQYDDLCALRIFGEADTVLSMLCQELGLNPDPPPRAMPAADHDSGLGPDRIRIPFDSEGRPIQPDNDSEYSVLDLREGSCVRMTGGPYKNDVGIVTGKNPRGDYSIRVENSIHPVFRVKRRPFTLWLGSWWLPNMASGNVAPGTCCPVVNTECAMG